MNEIKTKNKMSSILHKSRTSDVDRECLLREWAHFLESDYDKNIIDIAYSRRINNKDLMILENDLNRIEREKILLRNAIDLLIAKQFKLIQ